MAYTASTIGANAGPAKALMDAVKPLLQAGGLTLVETWTLTTQTADVYLSPAASNGVVDWYLILYRVNDTNATFYPIVAEGWNTSTKFISGFGPNSGSNIPDASFRYNVTPNRIDLSNWNNYATITGGTAGFSYWLSVNVHRVVLATRVSTTDYGSYMGLYDDVLPAALQFPPLVQGQLVGNNGNQGSIHTTAAICTREPGQTVANPGNFAAAFVGAYTSNTNSDVYLGGAYTTARVYLQTLRNDKALGVRGLLKDVITTGHTAINGDNLIVTMQDGSTKDYFRARSFWCDKAA